MGNNKNGNYGAENIQVLEGLERRKGQVCILVQPVLKFASSVHEE